MQRLQVGSFGLAAMILIVGLANVIMNSAAENQATAVPEAAPTTIATETPVPARDPLADAGVVPDLPAEPEPGANSGARNAPPAAGQRGATLPGADPAPRQ